MADNLTPATLLALLADRQAVASSPMRVLRAVSRLCSDNEVSDAIARDAVIRLLESREALASYEPILSALVQRVGLYPYADEKSLTDSDAIAREAHRPEGDDVDSFVFHQSQAYVYRLLMDGQNVILSAPTSYGKSLIIDAVLAAKPFRNAAVVVPTIALLDETRRRLASMRQYKLITHSSQPTGDRNLFVMTQERLLEYPELPRLDFFAIDEFYKLDVSMDRDRSMLLNQLFYRLLKGGGQFYLLGPDIYGVIGASELDAHIIHTPFKTVALDVRHVQSTGDERADLVSLCSGLQEPTIIYCRSPQRTRQVASWLLEAQIEAGDDISREASAWVSEHFNPDWVVALALAHGIAVHHGKLPRSIAHLMVRLFNRNHLRFLVCTSTLIEGVNTAAKNVIIFDNTVARKTFDFFTFNNIRGRSGRMFRHFTGNVFLFHAAPEAILPEVEIPVLTQSEAATPELLVSLDEADLTAASAARIDEYVHNGWVSIEVLRENQGVPLGPQIAVARVLNERRDQLANRLAWNGLPTYEQLEAVCELIWQLAPTSARGSVRSYKQLAFLLSRLSSARGDLGRVIADQVRDGGDPNEHVENTLDFVRQWPGHHLPKLLLALQRLEEAVWPPLGVTAGDYRFYASRVEHLFLPKFAAALEEYGVPAEVSQRVPGLLATAAGLDEVLDRLRRLDVRSAPVTHFERRLLADAKASL